jgi:hypothetical protein
MLGRRIGSMLAVAVLAATTVVPVSPVTATEAPGADPGRVVQLASQRLSWAWADGSTATKRSFRQDEYTGREGEIAVVVYAAPELPQRKARLQVRQGGKWVLVDDGVTDLTAGEGQVTLSINPICRSGTWCKGTFKLRIKVLKTKGHRAAYKTLKVKFVPSTGTVPAPTPTPAPATPAPAPSQDCSMYAEGSMDWYLCMHDPGAPA